MGTAVPEHSAHVHEPQAADEGQHEHAAPRAARKALSKIEHSCPTVLTRNARVRALAGGVAEDTPVHFAWMQQVQLDPMPERPRLAPLRYEARPASLRTESRTYNSRKQSSDSAMQSVEMAAFKFQR